MSRRSRLAPHSVGHLSCISVERNTNTCFSDFFFLNETRAQFQIQVPEAPSSKIVISPKFFPILGFFSLPYSGMLLNTRTVATYLNCPFSTNFYPSISSISKSGVRILLQFQLEKSISSLKVIWRKDRNLDRAIVKDNKWRLCARVVKEVLNEPGQTIPLRYLEKRRERLKLKVRAKTFINENPGLFDTYLDRIKPNSELVPFVRPSDRLFGFLESKRRFLSENELLIVEKLCKLLMMSKDKVISVDKLLHVKREFGFPEYFLSDLVPKYSNYFRLLGSSSPKFLELVSWELEFGKSVIMKRAEEEETLTGIRVRPAFNWKLPPGFFIRKEMREWVRDWMEMPYISPYDDASHFNPASPEMEKRMVGVLHELLSLSLFKRVPVPILGKLGEEYMFSNAFSSVFTRHSGIFYMSLKGGIKTAMLREAYRDDVLINRDPLLKINDKFVELLEEGWRERTEQLRAMNNFEGIEARRQIQYISEGAECLIGMALNSGWQLESEELQMIFGSSLDSSLHRSSSTHVIIDSSIWEIQYIFNFNTSHESGVNSISSQQSGRICPRAILVTTMI
ncbi:hypothetical protein Nepgr_009827 [Nepenthes gracilis]|uniref:PORR domain-containing protein n=1 Tax=Nepenthes gracilis TaxID=150966 RepID=A0AAD3SBH3_NEPGR|nr:hypothetical protein Nepgr_009827 [Nepenthes gracilis]